MFEGIILPVVERGATIEYTRALVRQRASRTRKYK